jgi:hypothetical protein
MLSKGFSGASPLRETGSFNRFGGGLEQTRGGPWPRRQFAFSAPFEHLRELPCVSAR